MGQNREEPLREPSLRHSDVSCGYRRYLLAVLLAVLAFNFVDRQVLGLVLQAIKVDLNLSDTQLGLLSGIAFTLFYSVAGVPIARWADRGNRVTIIALTAAVWSIMVACCGLATGFVQLLLIRMGVGVGEAGCVPPAHSLIADTFSRAERPRAVARYMLGVPLSVVIGFFWGGWLNEHYGWRVTFFALGLPGLALAGLTWFTLKEPRCGTQTEGTADGPLVVSPFSESATQPSFKEVWVTLWANATFRRLLLCYCVQLFFGNGISVWLPAYFIRSYGLGTQVLGVWFAVIWGGGGTLGTYWGGELANRHAHQERLHLVALAMVWSGLAVLSTFVYLSPNQYVAFGIVAVFTVGSCSTSGPLWATIQTLVPERMRATAIALFCLFANLIGWGLGPVAAGALSDAFRPWVGDQSLRYALLALSPGYLWVSWYFWRASKTVTRDLAAALVACPDKLTQTAGCRAMPDADPPQCKA